MAASRPARPLRVLIDTNVVLDQLLRRDPWYTQAQPFWQARDAGQLVAYLPASAVTDIFYISRRQVGNDQTLHVVARCLREFGVLATYRAVLQAALGQSGPDFEDNVQIASAHAAGLDCIVTRDPAGYRHSPIQALEPAIVVSQLLS